MGRYDEDEDEVTPRRAATKYADDDDDTEDEAPVKAKPSRTDDTSAPRIIKRGWSAVDSVVSADSAFAQRLKVGDDPIIVKFLEDEPYAVLRQHWIERSGQKSFTCIADLSPKGCPLCDAGNRPSSRFNFNVALLVPGDEPLIKSYEVGVRVIDQLKNFSIDPRQGPLTKHYWAISRSGKGARSSTNHQMIRDRDLEEYGIDALDEDGLKALRKKAYDSSIIPIPEYKTLLDVAKEDLDD